MAGEWRSTPLGELCDDQRGITYGIVKVGEFIPGGVPVVRGGDIRDGRIVCDDSKRVTPEVSNQFRRTILRGGEIVLNLIADPGHSAIVPYELAGHNVSRDVAVIPLAGSSDARFVDFFLKSKIAIDWLTARLQGSVTQKINLGTLRELPVPQPLLVEQKAIAAVLGSLDDKIELNRQMSATLEEMALAVFKSWFVHFDPVHAKSEGRPTGLPSSVDALFPDSFTDSPLGPIPTGWVLRPLDTLGEFLNGLALQKYPDDGGPSLPVIKIAQLRKGNSDGADKCSRALPSQYIVDDGDILFSWSGSLECVVWTGGEGALNQHLFKVNPAPEVPKWFIYQAIHHHLPNFRHIAAGKATTMGHIQRHHLTQAQVAWNRPAVAAASTIVEPLFERAWRASLESRTLATLRDTLLPKLISGELRVPLEEPA